METTVRVTREGRWRWTVWATTIPAGGTRVDTWRRWSRAGAYRKAYRVLESRKASSRWAESHTIGRA